MVVAVVSSVSVSVVALNGPAWYLAGALGKGPGKGNSDQRGFRIGWGGLSRRAAIAGYSGDAETISSVLWF